MGRLLARILGVLAVGLGVGLLTWGISASNMGEQIRVPEFLGEKVLQSSSELIGWGAGILAVGLTTLVLTLLDRRPPGDWDE
jgi:hypothetical protein